MNFARMLAALSLGLAWSLVCDAEAAKIQCYSQNNVPVDYWAMIKFPHISSSDNVNVAAGYGYAYIDSKGTKLVVPSTNLNSSASPLQATLKAMYASHNAADTAWALFNDEWPSGKTTSTYAHMKGVMFFDENSGFYLLHSVPRFPNNLTQGYSGYPLNEITYGQSFLCASHATDEFDTLGLVLQRAGPWFYDVNLPTSMRARLPNFYKAISGGFNSTPGVTVLTVSTIGGFEFLALYKNKQWNSELYEYLVAPTLQAGLSCETWMNGATPLPSFCKPQYAWNVLDIRTLAFSSSNVSVAWKETQDHSKWAVAIGKEIACMFVRCACVCVRVCSKDLTIACLLGGLHSGGINRMQTQYGRGGGTFCLASPSLYAALNSLIVTADTCPN